MGFFLIDKTSEKPFEGYFESVEDSLIYIYDHDIDQRYILVEGNIETAPHLFIESTQFTEYSQDNLRSGKLAQEHFKILARENGLIAEPIPQDKESYYATYDILKDNNDERIRGKRADFNIKNCILTEVEVKCLTFYPYGIEKNDCFFIKYAELKGLQNLNKETGMKTVFAIFKKDKGNVISDTVPFLIDIDDIVELNRKGEIQYCQNSKSYIIPAELTEKGLGILLKRKRN